MKVKLKTLEQVLEEFEFKIDGSGDYYNEEWYIDRYMFKYFGKEIEVRENENEYNSVYDYYLRKGYIIWFFHNSWFEPEEFFKKEEFEI